jgi:hypothetical protein
MKRIKDDQPVRAATCASTELDAVRGGWEDGGWGDYGDYGGDWSGGSGLPDYGFDFPGWYDNGQSCVIPEDYLCC